MDPTCLGEDKLGAEPVGVTGGDGEWFRECSSSESLRPRTFLLDLRFDNSQVNTNSPSGHILISLLASQVIIQVTFAEHRVLTLGQTLQ